VAPEISNTPTANLSKLIRWILEPQKLMEAPQAQVVPAEASMKPPLNINVGLVGHIDSGKTSLAKALSTHASTAAFDKNPQVSTMIHLFSDIKSHIIMFCFHFICFSVTTKRNHYRFGVFFIFHSGSCSFCESALFQHPVHYCWLSRTRIIYQDSIGYHLFMLYRYCRFNLPQGEHKLLISWFS
jgi:hypothetical protein